jgi:hypothetical protein
MRLDWRLPSEKPVKRVTVITEHLDGGYYIDDISDNFDDWADSVVRWAHIPKDRIKDEDYAYYQKKVREYYEDKIDDLKNIIYHNMADTNDISIYERYNNLLAEIHSWLYGNNGKGRSQNVRSTSNTSRRGSDWDEDDPPMPKPIPEEKYYKTEWDDIYGYEAHE